MSDICLACHKDWKQFYKNHDCELGKFQTENNHLVNENKELKELCKELVEVCEFYKDKNNWQSVQVGYGTVSQIIYKDLEDLSTDDTIRLFGGKRARSVLTKHEKLIREIQG